MHLGPRASPGVPILPFRPVHRLERLWASPGWSSGDPAAPPPTVPRGPSLGCQRTDRPATPREKVQLPKSLVTTEAALSSGADRRGDMLGSPHLLGSPKNTGGESPFVIAGMYFISTACAESRFMSGSTIFYALVLSSTGSTVSPMHLC